LSGPPTLPRFVKAGYTFAIRYVPRVGALPHDITAAELRMLLNAGLGVMLVQHVERAGPPVVDAARNEGHGVRRARGRIRARHRVSDWRNAVARSRGHRPEDGSGDRDSVLQRMVRQGAAVGYQPGIYVGYNAILNASQLYQRLKFQRYWSAYNLDKDQYPGTRGVCMQQHEAHGLFAARAASRSRSTSTPSTATSSADCRRLPRRSLPFPDRRSLTCPTSTRPPRRSRTPLAFCRRSSAYRRLRRSMNSPTIADIRPAEGRRRWCCIAGIVAQAITEACSRTATPISCPKSN
jgi:hypothetical protein